jgi:hypothetical protein
MNEERPEKNAYWLVIVRPRFLTGGDTKGLFPPSPWLGELVGVNREGGHSFSFCFFLCYHFSFFHVIKEPMKTDGECLI